MDLGMVSNALSSGEIAPGGAWHDGLVRKKAGSLVGLPAGFEAARRTYFFTSKTLGAMVGFTSILAMTRGAGRPLFSIDRGTTIPKACFW